MKTSEEKEAPSAAAGEPIGYISRDTLAKLQGPDLAADESARLWHAENPPSRAVVPVFLAHPAAPVQPEIPRGCAVDGNGTTYHNVAETYYQAEACEALHMWLDDQAVLRADAEGKEYSPVGRVARLLESKAVQPVAVPAGWKLVPVEPTEEMLANGDVHMDGVAQLGDAWASMLAAAPSPAAVDGAKEEQQTMAQRDSALRQEGK